LQASTTEVASLRHKGNWGFIFVQYRGGAAWTHRVFYLFIMGKFYSIAAEPRGPPGSFIYLWGSFFQGSRRFRGGAARTNKELVYRAWQDSSNVGLIHDEFKVYHRQFVGWTTVKN
jgi:hypothetical protein